MDVINRPRVSKAIARTYIGFAVFIGFIALIFIYLALFTPAGIVLGGASFVLLFLVEPLFLMLIRSLYNTKYVISDEKLIIDTSVLIGGRKEIPLESIETVEKTLYPLGLKLFGASFHGGYYKVPGLGRTFIALTNLGDAVLIKTKRNNYVISPRCPVDFIESVKSRIVKVE